MPLLLLPLAAILFALVFIVGLPFSIVQRYRAGTARRQGRGWMAAVNVISLLLSMGLFLVSAAITSIWLPKAFLFSIIGIICGCALGLAGLALVRWENSAGAVHYTPNRWLVLSITLAVAARIAFGVWRAWRAWHTAPGAEEWLRQSGLAGSMGAGALVLGYYLSFWTGIWLRLRSGRRLHAA